MSPDRWHPNVGQVRLGNFAPRPLDPSGNEIQDAVDECVDEELEKIRAKRLQDMKRTAQKERQIDTGGKIKDIARQEFMTEVNESSKTSVVVVHLANLHDPMSRRLDESLSVLAKTRRTVKFVRGFYQDLILGFPSLQLPAVVVYSDGKCVKQLIGKDVWTSRVVESPTLVWKALGISKLEQDDSNDISSVSSDEGQLSSEKKRFKMSVRRDVNDGINKRIDRREKSSRSEDDISDDDDSNEKEYSNLNLQRLLGAIWGLLTLSPIFVAWSVLTIALVRQSVRWFLLLIGLILSTTINEILKAIVAEPRPEGSFRGGYGMPSDHCQFYGFIIAYGFLFVKHHVQTQPSWIRFIPPVLAVVFIFLPVAYSRVHLLAHTWAQVRGGVLVGLTLGSSWFWFVYQTLEGYGLLCRLQSFIDLMMMNNVQKHLWVTRMYKRERTSVLHGTPTSSPSPTASLPVDGEKSRKVD
ncbi:Phosducinlike [Perkinsus chesapeaki]|uniref:Phosducinlike n=1 Tax=Perkinsus chesapeaki TaxID=330153 RepID=A0A7J6M2F8_PERCH|nr:Phosducinlike [Perkinsus chesapeaki]